MTDLQLAAQDKAEADRRRLTYLEERLRLFSAALQWYAERDNYKRSPYSDAAPVDIDSGRRAREALHG